MSASEKERYKNSTFLSQVFWSINKALAEETVEISRKQLSIK